ncbi:MAG: T9SS type A sorting domain-containing protein, partial [Ignavibacteriaceae bacterium]
DRTAFDDVGKLGYVYHPGGNPDTYVGTALVSSESYGFWAIANAGDSGFQIYDGFSSIEKFQAISSGVGKAQAGPGDISHVISGGPFTIPANGSISTAFAVTAGPGLEALRNYIANARSRYNILTGIEDESEIPLTFSLAQNFPNPFNPVTSIKYTVAGTGFTTLKVYDILGNELAVLINEVKVPGEYTIYFNAANLPSGVYFYELRSGSYKQVNKMMLLK